MREHEYNQTFKRYASSYENNFKDARSPSDKSQAALDDLFSRLSDPLKKMQAEVLSNIARSCYKDRHVSDNFTNWEQISLCRESERSKVCDKFDESVLAHRNSDRFRF